MGLTQGLGFESGLIGVETVRVMWRGQMWGVLKQHLQILNTGRL